MSARMDLSFCIVNTNGRALLERCLDAIARCELDGLEHEVLVLDNASDDQSAAMVEQRSEPVRLIALRQRQGKAASDTQLINAAGGEFCLLLNEDSELEPEAPRLLLAALRSQPRAAAAGAQLLNGDGERQPCAWRFTGVASSLASLLRLHRRFVVQSRGNSTRVVDWAQSAALLVRRAPAQSIGGFDAEFFVYGDEVDFCRRLSAAGWRTLYVPAARAFHREGLSKGASARRRIVQFHRGRDLYMRKHHSPVERLLVRGLTALTYLTRAIAAVVLPGHDPQRYIWHARAALLPWSGEGMSEAALKYNQRRR